MTEHFVAPPDQPEIVSADLEGMEDLIARIGSPILAEAVGLPGDSPIEVIRGAVIDVESATLVGIGIGIGIGKGNTYDLFDKLGRRKLIEIFGLSADASDDALRAGIRELDRRSLVKEFGLDSNATMEDVQEARRDRELDEAVIQYGLQPGSSWEDVYSAKLRVEAGLPLDATDEELKIAQDAAWAASQADTEVRSEIPCPTRRWDETAESWDRRTIYPNAVT